MPYVEAAVAKASEIEDGQMRQVQVGETEVLLARTGGKLIATHAHCTHYGAPLAEGALRDGRVVCPWHHACFRLDSGRQEGPPGRDDLPCYDVRVEGDDVYVRVPTPAPERRYRPMARRDEGDGRQFIIVGGGAAGTYAAMGLREAGFTGRTLMLSADEDPPYDRPNCSKDYLQGAAPQEWMPLRPEGFWDDHDIELRTGSHVERLDAEAKKITLAGGLTLDYDACLVATGGVPRSLDVPGADLDGIHTLRTLRDSDLLREAVTEGTRVVVVGASFIGMEGAFSLGKRGAEVTVVAPEAVPFGKLWGERVGRRIQKLHEENGVAFQLEAHAERFEGDGRVERVVLDDGSVLEADVVLVGIGVDPATGFVEGVERDEDGGLPVGPDLRVAGQRDLFAAGDVARVPLAHGLGTARIEHWRVACGQGRAAGHAMAGGDTVYTEVPFFWTAHWGTNFRYVGHAQDFDEVRYDGDVDGGAFIARYVQDGRVVAALGSGRDQQMAEIHQHFLHEGPPAAQ